MLSFKKKVYWAAVEHADVEGRYDKPQKIAAFVRSKDADKVASGTYPGDPLKTGDRSTVVEEEIDIRVFVSIKEYEESQKDTDLESAKEKLTLGEWAAVAKHFAGAKK